MTSGGLKRDWPLTIVTIAMMKVDDDEEASNNTSSGRSY
jgi:hypothetical protein